MLNDADIIAQLEEQLEPQALTEAVRSLRRVPEVWQALHHAGFLADILTHPDEVDWTAASIADCALLYWTPEASAQEKAESHQDQNDRVGALFAIARDAHDLVKAIDRSVDSVIERFQQDPLSNLSVLSCGWSHIQNPEAFLDATLVDSSSPAMLQLITKSLLANFPSTRTAHLLEPYAEVMIPALPGLQAAGEQEFVQAYAHAFSDRTGETTNETIADAQILSIMGKYDHAHDVLTQAWDSTIEATATIADQLAALAREEGNLASELEARRQAVEKACTPERKAAFARVLVESDRSYEAYQLVAQPEITQERIAFGRAALSLGYLSKSEEALSQARSEALQLGMTDISWLTWLAGGLEANGDLAGTIELTQRIALLVPEQSSTQLHLSELNEIAGDYSSASQHAYLALSLSPDSISTRKQLAHSLRLEGETERALTYFEQVMHDDGSVLEEYCLCALEARKADLALELAQAVAKQTPTAAAHTLLARANQLAGSVDEAETAIKTAISLDSSTAEPWLVLAEIQQTKGDRDAAGATLLQAIETLPEDGSAHHARAMWLAAEKRVHEALENSTVAIGLDPHKTSWLVDHAELVSKKGDLLEARVHLDQALRQQPKNWRVREALAHNLEQTDELESALELVEELPKDITDHARILAARIMTKYGHQQDPAYAQKGLDVLEQLHSESKNDVDVVFWKAMAFESLGQYSQAFKHFLQCVEAADDNSHSLEAALGYARTAIHLGKPEEAAIFLETNRSSYPASIEILNLLAQSYMDTGKAREAFEIAKETVDLNPLSTEARKLLSVTAEASGDIRTAIDAENQIVTQDVNNLEGYRRLAILHTKIKEPKTARGYLAKAIQLGRHDANRLHELAKLGEELGWEQTQYRLMKQAGHKADDQIEIQRDLAELAEDRHDFETAYQAWLRCIELRPDDTECIRQGAAAATVLQRYQEAINLWEQAVEIAPEDHDAFLNLARVHSEAGSPQTSLKYYQHLLDQQITDPESLTVIGRAFLQYDDTARGMEIIRSVRAEYPNYLPAHLAYTEALLQDGKGPEALTVIENAMKLQPPDSYTLSLAALSALTAGDSEQAKAGLEEALHETDLPPQASGVLMLVSAAIGEWKIHKALLESIARDSTRISSTQRFAERVLLRNRDLSRLFDEAFNLRANKPDREVIEAYLAALVVPDQDQRDVDAQLPVAGMRRWINLLDTPTMDVEADVANLSLDERQEFIQAASIGLILANRPAKALSLLDEYSPSGLYRDIHAVLVSLATLMLEQYARAKDAAERSMEFIQTRALGAYIQAKIAIAESDDETAITALNAALSIYADEPVWHTELAQLYARSEVQEAAVPHLQQAVELDPENGDYILALARAYRRVGEISQAEEMYVRCLQDPPGSAQVWKEAGEVALINGHGSQAQSWFERACSLAPSDAVCLMGSARAALMVGDLKLAAERAQSAYKLAPNEPQVLTGFAEILTHQGKNEKAIQAYDRALKISAGDPHVQLARSRLLLKTDQIGDAINDIQEVIRMDGENPEAWALLAQAQEGSNRIEEAIDSIQHAIALSPRSSLYLIRQGRLYRKSGQLDQALKVMREIEISEPDNPEIASELGQIYEARRETDTALEAYLRAVQLNTQDVDSCMRAGLILKDLKSYEHAADMFERVVTARPSDAKALHQLAAVRALQLVHGGIEKEVVAT